MLDLFTPSYLEFYKNFSDECKKHGLYQSSVSLQKQKGWQREQEQACVEA